MNKALTTLRTADDLAAAGLIRDDERAAISAVGQRYAVAITPAMTALIDPRDEADPIARQFVPSPAELITTRDELRDPIGDAAKSPVKGIVHRYPDRVLLKLANVCPVYCRFCFRRETVGQGEDAALSADDLAIAIAYIAARPQVFEVIVTGGDPLILSPRRIAEVTRALGALAHVKVIRWHTRVPVVAPERVTRELVSALTDCSTAVYVALHANHARELTGPARQAIARLVDAGIAMVAQTVLLKGINDDAATLEELFRALLANRVKPYYLHHGDLAPGSAHFRTSLDQGRTLMAALRARLSGMALPTYVIDIPGGHGKVPVDADHVGPRDAHTGSHILTDPTGSHHVYRDRHEPPAGEHSL